MAQVEGIFLRLIHLLYLPSYTVLYTPWLSICLPTGDLAEWTHRMMSPIPLTDGHANDLSLLVLGLNPLGLNGWR